MAQVNVSDVCPLPGIVTDQPEIFESEPSQDENLHLNNLDLNDDPSNDAIALIEVPIRQAFSYFADRENEIAQFYVQRYGEYKISSEKPEDESDIEKYHRLVSEVTELLSKFQTQSASKADKSTLTSNGSLSSKALTNNLEVIFKQLKTLESAADDGRLDPVESEFKSIKSKLESLGQRVKDNDQEGQQREDVKSNDQSGLFRTCALERRLNLLETVLGYNEEKMQALQKITNGENLTDVAEILASWVSMMKPENVQRVNKELDYLTQRLEKLKEQVSEGSESDNKLDTQTKLKLDHLCNLATASDKYRSMVPTILHRLNAMEELQLKASQVASTVNHLEQVQAQIVDNLHANKDELASLNEMFSKNLELVKEVSADIEARITAIGEQND